MLKNQIVSSHIAGMLASQDLRIVIGALQMANILMTRLPHVFRVHFHREGVLHQVRQLADPDVPLGVSPPKCPSGKYLFQHYFPKNPHNIQFCKSEILFYLKVHYQARKQDHRIV